MKVKAAAILLILIVPVTCAQAAGRRALELGNGAQPFYGDRPDLTTISPNGDGFRDSVRIRYQASSAGSVSLEVDRADRKGEVFAKHGIPVLAGASSFTWAPAESTPPGTYVVRVFGPGAPTERAVVRIQGVDAATGSAGYAQGQEAHVAVSTDAPTLRLDVIRVDATSWRTAGDASVIGTRVAGTRVIPWSHVDQSHDISFHVGNWRSGVYFARLTAPDGRVGFAPFVVRPRHLGASTSRNASTTSSRDSETAAATSRGSPRTTSSGKLSDTDLNSSASPNGATSAARRLL